jgi:predicted lipid carrier protein YhbT
MYSMQTTDPATDAYPIFPRMLSLPFMLIPGGVHSMAIVTVLDRVFAAALQEGELDFLQDRTVYIHIHDMRLAFRVTLAQGGLVPGRADNVPDLSITGSLHAFLLLAARHEDTDTLFFQRRLRMEGDTELGLEVKNFLDGLDLESLWLPGHLETMLQRVLPFYERVFG